MLRFSYSSISEIPGCGTNYMIRALHQVPFENCLDAGLSTLLLFHGGAFGKYLAVGCLQ